MTSWSQMHGRPRHRAPSIERHTVPRGPGAYAWYRGTEPVYVGKADDLRARVWGNHLSQSPTLSNSAFRRNIAEHLGIATAEEIARGAFALNDQELAEVRAYIDGCELAWLTSQTPDEAVTLESALTDEWRPPLTEH